MKLEIKSGKIIAEGKSVSDWLERLLAEEDGKRCDMVKFNEDGPHACKDIFNMIDIKKLPSLDEALVSAKERNIDVGENPSERIFNMFASDERVDSHGDIVKQDWDLTDYQKNPVILPQHNWGAKPIGMSLLEKIVKRKTDDYKGPALQLTEINHDLTEESQSYTRLMRTGFLRTGSVGFYPGKVIDVEDEKERQDLGLGKYGYILMNNRLIEHSIVTLPANTGAQIINSAVKNGLLAANDIQMIRECYRSHIGTKANGQAWTQTDFQMRSLWKRLFPKVKVDAHSDPEEPIDFTKIDIGKALDDDLSPDPDNKSKSVFNLFPKADDESPDGKPQELVDIDDPDQLGMSEVLNEALVVMNELKEEVKDMHEQLNDLTNKIQPEDGQSDGSLGSALCSSFSDKP